MLLNETHTRLLDMLESAIDLEHVSRTEKLHNDLWEGCRLPYLPCVSPSHMEENLVRR